MKRTLGGVIMTLVKLPFKIAALPIVLILYIIQWLGLLASSLSSIVTNLLGTAAVLVSIAIRIGCRISSMRCDPYPNRTQAPKTQWGSNGGQSPQKEAETLALQGFPWCGKQDLKRPGWVYRSEDLHIMSNSANQKRQYLRISQTVSHAGRGHGGGTQSQQFDH